MSFDGFEPTPLIENMGFVASVNSQAEEPDAGPVLDLAPAQRAEDGRATRASEILSEHAELRAESMALDLWINAKIGPGSGPSTAILAFDPLNEPLNIKEIGQVANYGQQGQQGQQEQHVIVTGHRYIYDGIGSYNSGGDHWQYSSEQPTPPPETPAPSPEDLNCRDTSQMTPEELLDYRISEEAAKVAREILAMPDHDTFEYASYIYMDANGVIAHTPISRGSPTESVPSDAGIRYGQIYAQIHSHAASTFSITVPEFKLFPTPDTAGVNGHGDWAAYDNIGAAIYTSVINEFGLSPMDALTHLTQFRQYILGPTSSNGGNSYQLHGYDMNDRDTDTLGQKISLNLGLCS